MYLELVWIERSKIFQARGGTGVKIERNRNLVFGDTDEINRHLSQKKRTRRGLINVSVAKVESGSPERFMCSSCI